MAKDCCFNKKGGVGTDHSDTAFSLGSNKHTIESTIMRDTLC